MSDSAPSDLTGSILAGRYRIVRKLGEGAMGTVYLGEHVKIGRQDAIKVLREALAGDAEAIARFNRGARNVAAIRHPNVCTIYDYSDTGDGTQFLAMQFVPGDSLKELLDSEGMLPLERAVSIAKQTADALQAAHEAGIVHRDLKPANIMISEGRAGEDLVTVVDFDIAKGSKEGEDSEVTRLGFVVGTPEYMSPEQLTGDRLDGRSDVYSLALVFFRMITGSLPFTAGTTQELMIKRLTQEPLRLDEVAAAGFPPALQAVLDRGLARSAEDRHPDASSFGRELLEAVGVGVGGAVGYGGDRAVVPGSPVSTRTDAIPATRVRRPVALTGSQARATAGGGAGGPFGRKPAVLAAAGLGGVAIVALAIIAIRGPGSGAGDDLEAGLVGLSDSGVESTEIAQDTLPTAAVVSPDSIPSTNAAQSEAGGGQAATEATGAPSGGPAERDAPVRPPTTTSPTVPLDQVNETIWRQFEMLGPPAPARAALGGIRDTADAVWRLSAAPTADRAMAAYVAGSAWFALGDAAQCATWLERALQLRPDGPGYSAMLDNCRRQLP